MELRLHVQCVTLPPHYLDKPGDTPKCKGYALVTFSTKSHAETVLRAWPWKRHRVLGGDGDALPIAREARKYGLRTISKAHWDALNEKYLLYKQSLVDEVARTQIQIHHPGDDTTEHEHPSFPDPRPETETEAQTQTTPYSPYPFGCLVFVRNIHPDTNKTTLKSLFAQAFQDGSSLDYVDFNRGMDTVRVRLYITYFFLLCRTLKRASSLSMLVLSSSRVTAPCDAVDRVLWLRLETESSGTWTGCIRADARPERSVDRDGEDARQKGGTILGEST